MKYIRKFLTSLAFCLLLSAPLQTVLVQAAPSPSDAAKTAACDGINDGIVNDPANPSNTSGCPGSSPELDKVLKAVLEILSFIAGIAAVIMVIYSGIRYTVSGGDSSKVATAKTTLIYALVGVVIVVFAQIIVKYVLAKA